MVAVRHWQAALRWGAIALLVVMLAYRVYVRPVSTEPSPVGSRTMEVVSLTPVQRDAAGIKTALAQRHTMQRTIAVPGQVRYDDSRHVEIRAATDVVVDQVLVKPGDAVSASQLLAVCRSPEIGLARTEAAKRAAELQVAERSAAWESETCNNVLRLIHSIGSRKPLKEVRGDFQSVRLGDYRSSLLTAYGRVEVAASTAAGAEAVAESGVLSGKVTRERLNEREVAESALRGSCEQAAFDAGRRRDMARIAAEDARRLARVSRERLASLLGYDEASLTEAKAAGDETLCRFECRAPFAGTIQRRMFSTTERAKQGDTLFVLADARRLWVAADVRQRDWAALQVQPGQQLPLECPVLPGRRLTARVHYVGREVDAATGVLPLVAQIENTDGLLRPGLFVRVLVPVGAAFETLAVPSRAVTQRDRERFVFVPEEESDFRLLPVTCGYDDGEWVEVLSGLSVATPVVTDGVFVLKSALFLEEAPE